LIICVVWALGADNLNRRNLSRACLIFTIASFILGIVLGIMMFSILHGLAGPLLEQSRTSAW